MEKRQARSFNFLVPGVGLEEFSSPELDAFCQVWFHLAQLFQRRRLKCEKVNGRTTDIKWWQSLTWPFGPGELKKENSSVYYFREQISLYSCDIVEHRTNLMISTSHGICRQLYHRQDPGLLCCCSASFHRWAFLILLSAPNIYIWNSYERKLKKKLNAY